MYCIDIDTLICQLNFSWIFLVSFLQITSQSRVKACFVQNVYCIDLIHFAFICQSNFSRISLVSFLQITSSPGSRLILKVATPALMLSGLLCLGKLSPSQSSVYPNYLVSNHQFIQSVLSCLQYGDFINFISLFHILYPWHITWWGIYKYNSLWYKTQSNNTLKEITYQYRKKYVVP